MELKKIAAIGGALSLALCWPLAVGHIGQTVIQDAVGQLSNSSVQAEIINYDRGYLTSNVKTRYTVVDPAFAKQLKADDLPTQIVVDSQVSHGLFSLKAKSVIEDLNELPLVLNTVTQLNGNTDYELNLDNWHQAGSDGESLSITKSRLKGHVSVLGEVSYDLAIPSIAIDFDSGEKMQISDITAKGEGNRADDFWFGDQTLNIKDLSLLSVKQVPLLALNDSSYTFSSSLDEASKRMLSHHIVDLNNVVIYEDKVDNFTFDATFGDLDSTSFIQLMELYQNNSLSTETDIEKATAYIDTLFAKGFYVALNKMVFQSSKEGKVESKLKVTVPAGIEHISQNPDQLLPLLTGNLDGLVTHAFVKQYPFIQAGIDQAVANGMAKKTEQGYQLTAELKQGELAFASGQKMPLMTLLLPMMMSY